MFNGYKSAISMRKVLITGMYEKVTKLSMKSLTETNSGKLITIANGDIQAIERNLTLAPMVISAPLTNLVAYIVLYFVSGWENSLITFSIWMIIMILQHISGESIKKYKMQESLCNDERQKLVNDMIVGARTIKCYGWEPHYLKKIQDARKK